MSEDNNKTMNVRQSAGAVRSIVTVRRRMFDFKPEELSMIVRHQTEAPAILPYRACDTVAAPGGFKQAYR